LQLVGYGARAHCDAVSDTCPDNLVLRNLRSIDERLDRLEKTVARGFEVVSARTGSVESRVAAIETRMTALEEWSVDVTRRPGHPERMYAIFALLLLPLVSACALGPTGDTPQAVCHREALYDPTVRLIAVQQRGSGTMSPKAKFRYKQAVDKAYDNCLLRRGVAVPGGVEAVQPHY
jgi:hypothetical protein